MTTPHGETPNPEAELPPTDASEGHSEFPDAPPAPSGSPAAPDQPDTPAPPVAPPAPDATPAADFAPPLPPATQPAPPVSPAAADQPGPVAPPAPATAPAADFAPPLPPATQPAQLAPPAPVDPLVQPTGLDDGTFTKIVEARSPNRLSLDGKWHQISPKYVSEQMITNIVLLLIVVGATLWFSLGMKAWWSLVPGGILIALILGTIIVTPRQARAIGYQLRDDDLVFRKGILWQRIVAVPYGRMQLVDITHGPLDRGFGLAQLKMVTAAATSGVNIPGLTQQAAEVLRDTLIDVAETRRTGL